MVVAVKQVQETARIVGEAPAIRKVADVADACPPGIVLISRVQPACIRQARDVSDLDAQSPFDDWLCNRIADLRVHRAGAEESQDYKYYEPYSHGHESSYLALRDCQYIPSPLKLYPSISFIRAREAPSDAQQPSPIEGVKPR